MKKEMEKFLENGEKYGFYRAGKSYTEFPAAAAVIACTGQAEFDGRARGDYDREAYIDPEERYVQSASDADGNRYDICFYTTGEYRKSEEALGYGELIRENGKKAADMYAAEHFRYFSPEKEDWRDFDAAAGADESSACDWDNPAFIRTEEGFEVSGSPVGREDFALVSGPEEKTVPELLCLQSRGSTDEYMAELVADAAAEGNNTALDGNILCTGTRKYVLTEKQRAAAEKQILHIPEYDAFCAENRGDKVRTDAENRSFIRVFQRISPEYASKEAKNAAAYAARIVEKAPDEAKAAEAFLRVCSALKDDYIVFRSSSEAGKAVLDADCGKHGKYCGEIQKALKGMMPRTEEKKEIGR